MSSTDRAPGYEISTDPARLDIEAMHAYLARSYWSPGIPFAIVERAARHSLCFGLYERSTGRQVGLARIVTDHATFAYLCDVYVLEEHRGRGLGKFLMRTVMAHPALTGARRAMQHGAFDFLQKPFRDQELLDRVQRALIRDTENRARLRHKDRIRDRLATLSPREREVLDLVTQGKANKMVAGDLGVSQRTVEIHRAHVMQKMEAGSLAELVRMMMAVAPRQ